MKRTVKATGKPPLFSAFGGGVALIAIALLVLRQLGVGSASGPGTANRGAEAEGVGDDSQLLGGRGSSTEARVSPQGQWSAIDRFSGAPIPGAEIVESDEWLSRFEDREVVLRVGPGLDTFSRLIIADGYRPFRLRPGEGPDFAHVVPGGNPSVWKLTPVSSIYGRVVGVAEGAVDHAHIFAAREPFLEVEPGLAETDGDGAFVLQDGSLSYSTLLGAVNLGAYAPPLQFVLWSDQSEGIVLELRPALLLEASVSFPEGRRAMPVRTDHIPMGSQSGLQWSLSLHGLRRIPASIEPLMGGAQDSQFRPFRQSSVVAFFDGSSEGEIGQLREAEVAVTVQLPGYALGRMERRVRLGDPRPVHFDLHLQPDGPEPGCVLLRAPTVAGLGFPTGLGFDMSVRLEEVARDLSFNFLCQFNKDGEISLCGVPPGLYRGTWRSAFFGGPAMPLEGGDRGEAFMVGEGRTAVIDIQTDELAWLGIRLPGPDREGVSGMHIWAELSEPPFTRAYRGALDDFTASGIDQLFVPLQANRRYLVGFSGAPFFESSRGVVPMAAGLTQDPLFDVTMTASGEVKWLDLEPIPGR